MIVVLVQLQWSRWFTGKGALSAIASVGPLEGATIGGAIGGVPGAFIGAGVGAVIQGIKAWKPKFFDDPVKGTKGW